MKRNALDFEELKVSYEVLSNDEKHSLKGGNMPPPDNLEWGIDPNGNYYYRERGTDIWNAFQTLEATVVAPSNNSSYFFVPGGYSYGGSGGSGGSSGSSGSGGGSSGGGTTTSTGYSTNTTYILGPSLLDGSPIENTGLIWGIAGGVWTAQGSVGITRGSDGAVTISTFNSIRPPQGMDNVVVNGSLRIYQNGVEIAAHSISTPDSSNTYHAHGTIAGNGSVVLPSNVSGTITVEITIGTYDDTGAGHTGNTKTYTSTFDVPAGTAPPMPSVPPLIE